MKLGVVLPQQEALPTHLLGAALSAEKAGLDSVWVSDFLLGRRDPRRGVLEAWSCLAMAASATERVTVGSLVLRSWVRPPRVTAAMVETLEKIATGRLVCGLGFGDETSRPELQAYGLPMPPKKERVAGLKDTATAIKQITPGVPVWVGGTSEEALGLAAGLDGWNFWGPVEEFAKHRDRLRDAAGENDLETSWAGSFPGEEAVARLREEGAGHVIVAVGTANFEERIAQLVACRV